MNVDPRVRFSLERTLLSWIRTGIALMGFGFLVARFSPPFNGDRSHSDFSLWIGISLIIVGIFINIAANVSFGTNLKRLENGEPLKEGRWSLGKILSLLISLLSLAMVFYLIFNN